MASRSPIILAATVGAFVVPIILVAVLPMLRSPTKRPPRTPRKLPDGVTRSFTPGGLELLVAKPSDEPSSSDTHERVPLLLLHGGFGTALCYEKWLPYLASKGRNVYSLSLSGHGLSPRPSDFVTMTAADFARDLEGALDYISSLHPDSPKPVLVGHSAGGGLSQYTLAQTQQETLTSGVILVDAFPPTGGWSVYLNWFFADPLFGLRILWQGGDPKAVLSSPALVQNVFFGPKMQREELLEFYEDMNPEESVGWPSSMMFPFVNVEKVKQHASGRVAWISGENDVLMTPRIMKGAAERYGAPLRLVHSAGHHLLRDNVWKEGADAAIAQLAEWTL